MSEPLVVGIDSSTTATKAIAWDRQGHAVAEGRARVPMNNPRPGWFEQDAEDWWRSTCTAIRQVVDAVGAERIEALAVANQRETFALIDAADRPVRPGLVWLDERSIEDVALLSERHGRETIREITGKTPDPTPAIYGLSWLARHEPESLAATAYVVEVHGYLVFRLTGERRTSRASADPIGVYHLSEGRYAHELLEPLGLTSGQFFEAYRPGTVLGVVDEQAAAACGLRPGTKVVAGGGDGQAAGFGCGVIKAGRAYLNLGTASVSGAWFRDYATDPAWRAMSSVSGEGYIFELCLRTGTFLTDWFVKDVFGIDPDREPGAYERLEQEAAAVPVGSDGLLLTPWWLGSMTPYWDSAARGIMIGLSPEHGRAHFYRAMKEGIALDTALGMQRIEQASSRKIAEVVAIGGGSRSDLWCQIVADATGRPVLRSATVEATSLGAAICAAIGAGWFADAEAAVAGMAGRIERTIDPDPARHARYRELLAIYQRLYPQLREVFADLAAFKKKEPIH